MVHPKNHKYYKDDYCDRKLIFYQAQIQKKSEKLKRFLAPSLYT